MKFQWMYLLIWFILESVLPCTKFKFGSKARGMKGASRIKHGQLFPRKGVKIMSICQMYQFGIQLADFVDSEVSV